MIDEQFYELPIFFCSSLDDLKYALEYYQDLKNKHNNIEDFESTVKSIEDLILDKKNGDIDSRYIGLRAYKTRMEPELEDELLAVNLSSIKTFESDYWTNFIITPEEHMIEDNTSKSLYKLLGMEVCNEQ